MAKCILTIDDSRNIHYWGKLCEIADKVDFKVCLAADLIGLNKERINIMKVYSDEGHEVCCHGTSHIELTKRNRDTISKELVSSKNILEQILGKECNTIVYPYGSIDLAVLDVAKAARFKYGRVVSRRMFGRPKSVEETDLLMISGINLPRDVSDRTPDEAVKSWVSKAVSENWLFCLYGHGKCDFNFEDWGRVFKALTECKDLIEVLTFSQL